MWGGWGDKKAAASWEGKLDLSVFNLNKTADKEAASVRCENINTTQNTKTQKTEWLHSFQT